MKKLLFSIMFLVVSVFAYAEPVVEIIGIPPAIQGVWQSIGFSKDGGNTITDGNLQPFCRVSINRILNTDGSVWTVKRIVSGKNDDGSKFIGVSFNEISTVWCITSTKPEIILVQVFDEDLTAEVMRVLFRVAK